MCERAVFFDPGHCASPTPMDEDAPWPSAVLEGVGSAEGSWFRGSISRPARSPSYASRPRSPSLSRKVGFSGHGLLPEVGLGLFLTASPTFCCRLAGAPKTPRPPRPRQGIFGFTHKNLGESWRSWRLGGESSSSNRAK